MNNEPVAWTACNACGQRVTGDSKHVCHPAKTLTDAEIWEVANYYFVGKNDLVYGFARAILRKAQEK